MSTWVVGVDGVGCPFCAYGLEKKLGGLDGVESFAFRFEDAEIDLGLSPGAAVAPDALAEAVDKAGFGLRSLVVIGQGTVSTVDGRRTLRLGPGLTLNLVGHDGPDGLTEVRGEVVNQAGAWSVRLSPI